jgi:F-type H+-transporting ATPase subunit a
MDVISVVPQEHAATPAAAQEGDTLAHARTGVAKTHGEAGENTFSELLHHVYDSHEIEVPVLGHVELPYIFFDQGKLYTYRNLHSVEQSGRYTTQQAKIVRVSDHQTPSLDLSITKHVVFLWLAALVLVIVAAAAVRRIRKDRVPRGIRNLIEVFVVFIRDEVAIPNMGVAAAARYMPYLLTTFFFILLMNLAGLVPYGSTATSNVSVTAGLAIIAFVMIQLASIRAQGLGHYLSHLTGGVHWALWPIMIPIEVLGLFTKPFALMIRLFANMIGGHIVIVSLIGLIFIFKSPIIAPIPILFVLGINLLELFVAFLQAYIFTMLTALFMGLGVQAGHEPSHDQHLEHQAMH